MHRCAAPRFATRCAERGRRERPIASALLHGDYWPGNVLWNGRRLVGVVDWEEACIGDPIADVAIARLDMLWAFGSKRCTPSRGVTRRCRASISTICRTGISTPRCDPYSTSANGPRGWPELGRPDVTVATMRAGHRTFVDLAFDALSA